MPRDYNTDIKGNAFDEETIKAVWKKGKEIKDIDSDVLRRDICKNIIVRIDYGKKEKYGWEIDHIIPVSKGGKDDLLNLQPLQWENNRAKGDKTDWKCSDRK